MKTILKTLIIVLFVTASAPMLSAMKEAEARVQKVKEAREAQKARMIVESLDLKQKHFNLNVLQKVLKLCKTLVRRFVQMKQAIQI